MISVIVISYNTRDMTMACLRSVLAETRETDIEVIVVDNASSDGSADAIASELPQVRLIRSPENHGFGRANNLAAADAKGEYLLLLNPDTVILDGAIDRLSEFAKSTPEAGMWGGRTIFANGTLNPSSSWRFISLWSLFCLAFGLAKTWSRSPIFNREAYGGWNRDTMRRVDIITGCFLLVQRDLWARLDGFDETFFMFAEEADLCFRARAFGARPIVTPSAEIIHYGGASTGVRAERVIKLYAGRVTFLRKHWSILHRVAGIGLIKTGVAFRVLGYSASARLRGSQHASAQAAQWRQVWSRREEWRHGY